MADTDRVLTRTGDGVRVEIKDATNPHGTMPNYGYTRPLPRGGFAWHIASGEHGEMATESGAVSAAAQAIRDHAARTAGE